MKSIRKVLSVILCAAFILSCFSVAVFSADNAPQVKTDYGIVQGQYFDGGMSFFGIPFAKPSTGERRFSPPVAPDSWDGIYNATVESKDPLQNGYSALKQSEDSLKLNIWVPDSSEKELAVMFWIYGGSYAMGGINEFYYDMKAFARETGCIIVSANYRLNVCGFLDLRDTVDGATVNNGLRDIVAALEWVNGNIEYFGGDKDNVTVFGQSAGAALALSLLAIPEADAYFTKVISQSACLDNFYTPQQAREVSEMWLELMGKPTGEELISMSPSELVSKVGSLDVKKFMSSGINCIYNPVIDGEFLVCHPSEIKNTDKKVLLGTNKDEASLFLFFVVPPLTFIPFAEEVALPGFSSELKKSLTKDLCHPTTKSLITLTTERMYRYPLTVFADNLSSVTDVYAYRYDYEPLIVKLTGLGAFHCTEIPLLFDLGLEIGSSKIRLFGSKQDNEVGSRMRSYWGNFAKYGDPSEDWDIYSAEKRETLIIDSADAMMNNPYSDRMSLYEAYSSPWKN